jgi:N4-gp56 family major capsid protein
MDNLTTTTQVDPAVATFYDRVLLKRGLPFLVHNKFAQTRSLASKTGNTMKFRRYSSLAVAKTPLAEGVTPPGQQLGKTDLLAQISQYGDYVHITDVVDLTVEDKVLTEAAELLGEQFGETIDELTRDILSACASATEAAAGGNAKTPTEITSVDIKKIVRTMLGNKAKMITRVISGTSAVGTTPVRASYWGILHTDLIIDLEDGTNCPDFVPVSKYPNQKDVQEYEWGTAGGNVRWLVTQKGDIYATSPYDKYSCFIIGQDAYGAIDLKGGTVKSIVKAFGSGGTADPLNQRATSGWKTFYVARILNDNFMHNLKVTKEV